MTDNYTRFPAVYLLASLRLPACRRGRPSLRAEPAAAGGGAAAGCGAPAGGGQPGPRAARGAGAGAGSPRPPLGGRRRPRRAEGRAGRRAAARRSHDPYRVRPQARLARAGTAGPAAGLGLPLPHPPALPCRPPPPRRGAGRERERPRALPPPRHPRVPHPSRRASHLSHRTVVAPLKRSPTLREDLSSGEVL